AVPAAGGNWLASRPACLAEKFAGIARVEIANDKEAALKEALSALAAEDGLIGLCTTNSGTATVVGGDDGVPWNTVTSVSWGFPRAQGAPVLVDQPSARGSWGAVAVAQQTGGSLSACVALDAEGQPTERPDEARLLLPWAGAAGVATGLIASMLSGVLSGGRLPVHKHRAAERDGAEHFFFVIDPQQFGDVEAMQAELESGIEHWQSAPGQEQWQLATDRLENGIPVAEP
ncbi:MAG: Ldh family oxidoreductase, partial [Planctomycetaceae bacterium]